MKIAFHPGKNMKNYLRRYAAVALFCVLLFAAYLTETVLIGSYDYGAPERKEIQAVFGIAFSSLWCGVLFGMAGGSLREKYRWPRFIPWLAALLGAGLGYLAKEGIVLGGLVGCSLMLFFHGIYRKGQGGRSLSHAAVSFWIAGAISVVLFLSLQVCIGAVFSLLFPDMTYYVQDIFLLVNFGGAFLLVAPALFLGGLMEEEETEEKYKWFGKLMGHLLLPAFLLLMAILLLYIGKILITLKMPVGEMNPYAMMTLTMFVLFHFLLKGEENALCRWFKKWGGLFMIPIVIAQGVGVFIRVEAYGLTLARVLGIIWSLLCFSVVIFSLLRKEAGWFFLAAAVCCAVFLCSPLHAENIALWQQEGRLQELLQQNGMLNEQGEIIANPEADYDDRGKIYSAVEYLNSLPDREGGLCGQVQSQLKAIREEKETPVSWVSDSDYEALLGFKKPKEETWYSHHYSFKGTAESYRVDARGWDYAEYFSRSQRDTEEEPKAEQIFFEGDIAGLALLAQSSAKNKEALTQTEPLMLTINGESADIMPVLHGLICDEEEAVPLLQDRITFPSGKVYHISLLKITHYNSELYENVTGAVYISGWLLTPEAE